MSTRPSRSPARYRFMLRARATLLTLMCGPPREGKVVEHDEVEGGHDHEQAEPPWETHSREYLPVWENDYRREDREKDENQQLVFKHRSLPLVEWRRVSSARHARSLWVLLH